MPRPFRTTLGIALALASVALTAVPRRVLAVDPGPAPAAVLPVGYFEGPVRVFAGAARDVWNPGLGLVASATYGRRASDGLWDLWLHARLEPQPGAIEGAPSPYAAGSILRWSFACPVGTCTGAGTPVLVAGASPFEWALRPGAGFWADVAARGGDLASVRFPSVDLGGFYRRPGVPMGEEFFAVVSLREVEVSVVPEPGSAALVAAGVAVLALVRARRRPDGR